MNHKLKAIENREMWPLTSGEKARLTALLARGGYKATRGKSTGRIDRLIEDVWADATRRIQAEERAHDKRLEDKAAAKAARKGWLG